VGSPDSNVGWADGDNVGDPVGIWVGNSVGRGVASVGSNVG